MTTYAALLRAVNVGGTGKLPMADLRALCDGCGFTGVATYIQSGNVVFRSKLGKARVVERLEAALLGKLGKPTKVLLRNAEEIARVLADNPYPEVPPAKLLVLFCDRELSQADVRDVATPGGERLSVKGSEVYIHFPNGMGASKLKLPLRDAATARNLNTVTKLVEMVRALG